MLECVRSCPLYMFCISVLISACMFGTRTCTCIHVLNCVRVTVLLFYVCVCGCKNTLLLPCGMLRPIVSDASPEELRYMTSRTSLTNAALPSGSSIEEANQLSMVINSDGFLTVSVFSLTSGSFICKHVTIQWRLSELVCAKGPTPRV